MERCRNHADRLLRENSLSTEVLEQWQLRSKLEYEKLNAEDDMKEAEGIILHDAKYYKKVTQDDINRVHELRETIERTRIQMENANRRIIEIIDTFELEGEGER